MPTPFFCLSPPTVRLNEHRPAAPESLGVAGAVLPDHLAIASRNTLLRESVRILTFELGERLLVAVLGALLALMLGDGVRRIEAEPLLVVGLGRHSVLLRAPGRPSEVEGAGFNVHAQPATQTIMTHSRHERGTDGVLFHAAAITAGGGGGGGGDGGGSKLWLCASQLIIRLPAFTIRCSCS